MNKNKLIIWCFLTLSLSLFSITSCDWADPDLYNVDPDNPTDAPMEIMLAPAQVQIAYSLGGDYGRILSVIMQQNAGLSRQHAGYDQYNITEVDFNNAWRFNMYAGSMFGFKTIIDKANDPDALSPHFRGVGKVMMAFCLGLLTDLHGDIPYSDAFKGADQRQPAYDTQQDVYNTIDNLLAEAITDLSAAESVFSPSGASDMFFVHPQYPEEDYTTEERLAFWTKLANSLKARYKLHLSQVSGGSSYSEVLSILDAGAMTDNVDNAEVPFGSGIEANPWFQFLDQREGDLGFSTTLFDMLEGSGDPRLSAYIALNGNDEYAPSPPGKSANVASPSEPGSYLGAEAAPVSFMTYMEVKFIEAEAAFKTNDLPRAAAAYNEGVKASCAKVGVFDSTFQANYASASEATITMEDIMQQKYIALYGSPEVYNDWRRTGLPALTPVEGKQFPNRMPYPQSERLFNGTNMPVLTNADKVWWDVD